MYSILKFVHSKIVNKLKTEKDENKILRMLQFINVINKIKKEIA